MQLADLLDENGERACHILDALSLHGNSREAGEIHRMPSLECLADLAGLLEASDPRSLARAGIDDKDWALAVVHLDVRRRNDPEQRVVDRAGQRISAQHNLSVVDQNRGNPVRHHLFALVAAPAQDVEE
jgi:hypothetical protein